MLIQVRLRGCDGVRSRRRHSQRESPLVVPVVVERDPASISHPTVGIDRRYGHFRVEKVRTKHSCGLVAPNPSCKWSPACYHYTSLLFCVFQVAAFVCRCSSENALSWNETPEFRVNNPPLAQMRVIVCRLTCLFVYSRCCISYCNAVWQLQRISRIWRMNRER